MTQLLGAYELDAELGRGGMGRVYRARHLPTGAERAVKVLGGDVDPESVTRFRREAEAIARLGGRGIVVIHESGLERGHLWYAMDLLPGGSLRDRVRKDSVPWREAVSLVAEIARVLARCHAHGIVHRDVKPDNVLLDAEGRPCLADFGCVRDVGASRLTETGAVIGTLAYMAPEQLEGEPASAASDVYALAVVLHELVSGTTPWEVGGTLLSHHAARKKPRPPLAAHGAPPALDVLLDRALCLERAGRTASAADFARELEGLLGRPEESAAGRPRRSLGLARAGALLVIVALGGAAYLQRQAARRELADAKGALEPVEGRLEGVEARIFGSGTTSDDSSTIDDAIHRAERAEAAARRAERFLLADAAPLLSAALAVEDRARGLERLRLAESAPASGLADLAPTFYEHGLATGSRRALEIGWRLTPPEGELARRVARRWIDLAEEATTRNAGQDLEKKKESRAGLRDAVELSRRVEKLVPEEGLGASWRVASVIREAREKKDSASKETDRLVIEIFAPWPEHPRCRAALAREALGRHDRETALARSFEGLEALPPRPATESDYPDLPETIYDLCWAWGDNGTYASRDSPALARPAVERVLAAAKRGGGHVGGDAWARMAQAVSRAGDPEGARRCIEAGRSSPDAESWPVDLERAEIFVLVAEKKYDLVIGRLRKRVPVEGGADALRGLAASLEEGDSDFKREAHEALGDPW